MGSVRIRAPHRARTRSGASTVAGIYDHGGECVMQRRDFLKVALAGLVSVPILGQGRRAEAAPLIITETFSGANTILNMFDSSQSLTGFDNPPGNPPYVGASNMFTGAWHVQPTIDSLYPCPVGSNKSLCLVGDTANFNFSYINYFNPGIKEFWYRTYIRLGDASSYSDYSQGGAVQWAKLGRVFSQTWQWQCVWAEQWNLADIVFDHSFNNQITISRKVYPSLVPCKWFYLEMHWKCNTPGNSDGIFEFWSRNVSDNGALYAASFPKVSWVGTSTETLDTVRIGGNTGAGGGPPNEVVRYANFAFSSSGWIGEIGGAASLRGAASLPSPPHLRAP